VTRQLRVLFFHRYE